MTQRPQSPILVMGVQGSGKSTIGAALAVARGMRFVDADALHSAAAKATMRAGTPLTDDDRWPWLARVAAVLAEASQAGDSLVVACSALKRSYRDVLRAAVPSLRVVHLDGPADLIAARLTNREHAYMPLTLLSSQVATLEPLAADEVGTRIDIDATPDEIVQAIHRYLDP